jgi:hypothetical protein
LLFLRSPNNLTNELRDRHLNKLDFKRIILMAKIQVNDLSSTGLELFSDSENYLKDMSEQELNTHGGIWFLTPPLVTYTYYLLR